MNLLTELGIFGFFLVFTRLGACFMVAPLFGGQTPIQVRVGLAGAIAFALTPLLAPKIGGVPPDFYTFVTRVGHEVLVGLILGSCLQMLLLAFQAAGSFIDLQIGLGSAQILNPMTQQAVTLFAQFKYWLALVLLLMMNGHHMMIQGLVSSYDLAAGPGQYAVVEGLLPLINKMGLLCLQVAAPAAAVCILVDVAAGVVNKAVPQMQVFVVGMPAKIVAGILAIAFGLPALVTVVQAGVEHSFDAFHHMLRLN